MAMEVVTGKRGEIHVTSAQAQGLNAGIFGTDAVVLNVADNLEATVISNNLVRVGAGHLINQGVQSCINHGEYEELAITSGTSSTSRIDLICAHYTKDGSTGVEDVELVVVAGTPVTTGTPEAPSVTRGNIINGALEDYCPLHKVLIKGLNIDSVELIPPIAGINQIDEKIEEVEKSLDDLAYVKIQGANEFEYNESKIEAKIRAYTYSKSQIDVIASGGAKLGTVLGNASDRGSRLLSYIKPVNPFDFQITECTFTMLHSSSNIGMVYLNLMFTPWQIPKTGYMSYQGTVCARITDDNYKPYTGAVLNVWGGGTANAHCMINPDGEIVLYSNAQPTDYFPIWVSGFYLYHKNV